MYSMRSESSIYNAKFFAKKAAFPAASNIGEYLPSKPFREIWTRPNVVY
jgi:hypothetical protein